LLMSRVFLAYEGDLERFTYGQSLLDMINNFDRPAEAYADGLYADADTYADGFENEPGKRIPKAGAGAEAGVGRAGAHWSIFEAEAKGPNASANAEANLAEAGAMARAEVGSASASAGPANVFEAGAMARAEVGGASASAGPVEAKLGLGVDTGVKISPTKIEAKVLGTGVTLGSTMGISLFGSELKIKLW
uniref:Uncharacterized protein n=1 Tax=Pygocentrus nattereri TaxID=42514 RepID=A0A3B4CP53_PYGNA